MAQEPDEDEDCMDGDGGILQKLKDCIGSEDSGVDEV